MGLESNKDGCALEGKPRKQEQTCLQIVLGAMSVQASVLSLAPEVQLSTTYIVSMQ